MLRKTFGERKYFLEVKGKLGKLYINNYRFGIYYGDGFMESSDPDSLKKGVASTMMMFPDGDPTNNQVHKVLQEKHETYYEKLSDNKSEYLMPECTIFIELKRNGLSVAYPYIKLFQAKVGELYGKGSIKHYILYFDQSMKLEVSA